MSIQLLNIETLVPVMINKGRITLSTYGVKKLIPPLIRCHLRFSDFEENGRISLERIKEVIEDLASLRNKTRTQFIKEIDKIEERLKKALLESK